jgi:hypothetical protein
MKHPPQLILCVDQAAVSGWCIVVPSVTSQLAIVDHGTATTFAARRTVLTQLLEHMTARRLTRSDLRMVLEDHSKVPTFAARGRRNHSGVFIGMGKAYGRWEEQALFAGLPGSHVHSVAPATWRGAMLGSSRGGDVARAAAVTHARSFVGNVGEDEAEAVCMALWAAANLERVLRGEPAPVKPRKKRSRKVAA